MKTRWLYAAAVAALALTSGAALAQGRGHGRDRDHENEHGHGHRAPPGRAMRAERPEPGRFDAQDRMYARNWYYHEVYQHEDRRPAGLRDRDRLPAAVAARLRPGWVVERPWRDRLYPVPVMLLRRFAPPPPGCRYLLFGGRLVLVDPGFRVVDVMELDFRFRP